MICHATGRTPTRQHPRRKFVYLHTPSGPLWFWDMETCQTWVDQQSAEYQTLLAKHDPFDTPGLIPLSPRPTTESEATP